MSNNNEINNEDKKLHSTSINWEITCYDKTSVSAYFIRNCYGILFTNFA